MLNENVLMELEKYINRYLELEEEYIYASQKYYAPDASMASDKIDNIEDYINENIEISFRNLLFKYIDQRNMTDAEVYKKAGVDRRLFSKIRSKEDYHPSKNTVIALSLAVELGIEEAEKIIESAGYSLSFSDKFDLVIRYCFENKIYDYMNVNEALDYFNIKLLVI